MGNFCWSPPPPCRESRGSGGAQGRAALPLPFSQATHTHPRLHQCQRPLLLSGASLIGPCRGHLDFCSSYVSRDSSAPGTLLFHPLQANSCYPIVFPSQRAVSGWATFLFFQRAYRTYSTSGCTRRQPPLSPATSPTANFPSTAMRSHALLALVLCIFAAFAAAWTKEGA